MPAFEQKASPTGNPPFVPEVSLVWATLNEAANLPTLVARLRAVGLPRLEVIVVDDGSADGTREYLRSLESEDSRFRLLTHDGKQTTVRAQTQGIAAARGRFVVIMDADLQHPPELVPKLLERLDRGDSLAIASRYTTGGSPGPRNGIRALISRGAEWLARRFAPNARLATDPVSGYFAFRREIFRPIDPRYRGYKLLLFVLAMLPDERVSEVAFQFAPRLQGKSKLTENSQFFRLFLVELLLVRRTYRAIRQREPS